MVSSSNNGSNACLAKKEVCASRMPTCHYFVGVKAPLKKIFATKKKLTPATERMKYTCCRINAGYDFERRQKSGKVCSQCETSTTPLWRKGPNGPKTLCNACGIRYGKEVRLQLIKDEKGNKKEEEVLVEKEEALGEVEEAGANISEFEDEKN